MEYVLIYYALLHNTFGHFSLVMCVSIHLFEISIWMYQLSFDVGSLCYKAMSYQPATFRH